MSSDSEKQMEGFLELVAQKIDDGTGWRVKTLGVLNREILPILLAGEAMKTAIVGGDTDKADVASRAWISLVGRAVGDGK